MYLIKYLIKSGIFIPNEKYYEIFICENKYTLSVIKSLKLSNANRLITGHINIKYIRNKFDELKYIIQGNVDIFIITETKQLSY